jgi:hypothetical protein
MMHEIEVTPEMIEAANTELEKHYLGDAVFDLSDDIIVRIYRVMRTQHVQSARGFQ